MNVLLLSMPDSFEHMPTVAIRMPNGALASLAGNIDSHHHVAIADLVLVQSAVRRTLERLLHDEQPDVVGLSVMTFQRITALKVARLPMDKIIAPLLPLLACMTVVLLFVTYVPEVYMWLPRSFALVK